jgi:hypothetical protein
MFILDDENGQIALHTLKSAGVLLSQTVVLQDALRVSCAVNVLNSSMKSRKAIFFYRRTSDMHVGRQLAKEIQRKGICVAKVKVEMTGDKLKLVKHSAHTRNFGTMAPLFHKCTYNKKQHSKIRQQTKIKVKVTHIVLMSLLFINLVAVVQGVIETELGTRRL